MFARARVLSLPLMIVGLAACPTPNGNPTSATPAAPTSSLAATASSPAASTSAAPAPTGTGGDSAESLAAAPCGASEWKHLPAKSFTRNTLVDDACIDIPAGATVAVASGITLSIIARRGLRIGDNVTIDAHGATGPKGLPAGYNSVYPNGKDNSASQCLCSADATEKTKMNGKAGDAGKPGGFVHLTGWAVNVSASPKISIKLEGGSQGPQGDCGVTDCPKFPGHSQPCCLPYSPTAAAAGRAAMVLDSTEPVRTALAAAVSPQVDRGTPTVVSNRVNVRTAFLLSVRDELADARAKGFDILPGI